MIVDRKEAVETGKLTETEQKIEKNREQMTRLKIIENTKDNPQKIIVTVLPS